MSSVIIPRFDEFAEQRFFDHLARLDQLARWAPAPYHSQNWESTVSFGRSVEVLAAELLRDRGHQVAMTGHQDHHDLWVGGARVEVKSSRWDGARFQFNLRRSRADVYLLATVADDVVLDWYVVPSEAIEGRRHVAIWNADPDAYHGRWASYRDAWELVDEAVREAGAVPWQLSLI